MYDKSKLYLTEVTATGDLDLAKRLLVVPSVLDYTSNTFHYDMLPFGLPGKLSWALPPPNSSRKPLIDSHDNFLNLDPQVLVVAKSGRVGRTVTRSPVSFLTLTTIKLKIPMCLVLSLLNVMLARTPEYPVFGC